MHCEFPDDSRFVLARGIILEAAETALSYFSDLSKLATGEKLNGQDVVSEADKAVEAMIRARIAATFPDDGVLGEEEGLLEGPSGYLWVVDPIDGTSCFVHGIDQWCISIAVMRGDGAVLGLICQPTTGDLFVARKDGGAFLNGKPMRVDGKTAIATGLLGVGANFRIPVKQVSRFIHLLLEAGGMFIRNGSGALMLAEVACGRLAGYYEPHINAWDCMAGLLMIREAGGWTEDFPGKNGTLLTGGPVIAAASQVRDELLQLIDRSLQDERAIA
ncbi:inositol monophosphatase [Rhizobium sp. Root1220]|uniref:inositol monophosphatase family protein n=1 Tax=Rhizobium sp. Root1220 TaxID=1736432 RepID=UPI0006FF9DFA|nr:inositol monophosphatase [Rhizobium sp. Root1220]KQV70380.1 inositol monophosphatase [Rhizobium sp. Root1220]